MEEEIKEIDRIIINVKRKLQFSPERRFVELFDKGDIKQLLDYITNLQEENERFNNIINLIKNNIDITIQIIKEQPTGNDEWILERLNGIKNIGELKGE